MMKRIIPVTIMRSGQAGTVQRIEGGLEMAARLSALGIQPGAPIIKRSALLRHGPVIVSVGTGELAIGHGMAVRILVEVN